jgi:hypothetical protein
MPSIEDDLSSKGKSLTWHGNGVPGAPIALAVEMNAFAPAHHIAGEPPDPIIPSREPARTASLCGLSDDMSHQIEHRDASAQLRWVRKLLEELRALPTIQRLL